MPKMKSKTVGKTSTIIFSCHINLQLTRTTFYLTNYTSLKKNPKRTKYLYCPKADLSHWLQKVKAEPETPHQNINMGLSRPHKFGI